MDNMNSLFTFCIQHPGNVEVLLSDVKGQIQVVNRVALKHYTLSGLMSLGKAE